MPATSYISSVGKREDLADIIAVVDAKECVLTSTIRKGKKPSNALVEWSVDNYPSTSTSGVVDGTDVTSFSSGENYASGRARIGTYIQTFRRVPAVSRLEENVAVIAGVNNPDPMGVAGNTEFARAKAKSTIMIKRDVETALLSDNAAQADNGTVPFKTRGLGKWLSVSGSKDSVQPVPDAYCSPSASIYSGTIASFTEDAFRTLLQSRWSQTGKSANLLGIVGSDVKNAISDFSRYLPSRASNTSVRFYNSSPEDKKVTTAVDIYSGDYGDVELFLSAFVPDTYRGYIVDPEYVELRTHTAPYFQQLPDLGGGPRGIVETIVALAVSNPLAHAKIAATAS
jgi:hypothetical protein